MPYFNSTAISRAEYDQHSEVLQIWFVESGGPYDFYGVPETVWKGFLSATSKGSYYNDYIRDQYRTR